MTSVVDHIAFLVADLDGALAALAPLQLHVGGRETYPSEGTAEVYLGAPDATARILLMQPLGDAGPYARALASRGPGLHHVALDVEDVDAFVRDVVAATAWYLHPVSLDTRRNADTVWLARPGVSGLVEVHETESPPTGDPVVDRVELSGLDDRLTPLFEGCSVDVDAADSAVVIDGRRFDGFEVK